MYITQYYELDPKLNITYVNYKFLYIIITREKTKITRTGKCIRLSDFAKVIIIDILLFGSLWILSP